MIRISDREISKLANEYYPTRSMDWNFIRDLIQAQLEACEKEVREIFEKIEALGYEAVANQFIIPTTKLKALKQECLEKK